MIERNYQLPNYNFSPEELSWCETDTCEVWGACSDCLLSSLKRTREGQALAAMGPRFSNFYWEDLGAFRKYMGPDVDPVMHGFHQAEVVAKEMVRHQNSEAAHGRYFPFNKEEAKLLYLANVAHDWHEGVYHLGDVPAPKKTREGMEEELELNLTVTASVLGLKENDPWILKYRGVVGDFEQWSPVGRAFAVGEQIGYFLTGLRAWGMRNHTELDSTQREQCGIMGKEVCLTAAEKMVPYCTEFAYVSFVLDSNAKALEQMYRAE